MCLVGPLWHAGAQEHLPQQATQGAGTHEWYVLTIPLTVLYCVADCAVLYCTADCTADCLPTLLLVDRRVYRPLGMRRVVRPVAHDTRRYS